MTWSGQARGPIHPNLPKVVPWSTLIVTFNITIFDIWFSSALDWAWGKGLFRPFNTQLPKKNSQLQAYRKKRVNVLKNARL